MANERLHWALFLHGDWSCGEFSLSEGSPLRAILEPATDLLPFGRAATGAQILRGPWCVSSREEASLSLALGTQLIPADLQVALADAAFDQRPISLVIAGNLHGLLPTCLLGFITPEGEPLRVLEAAVLRVAPPSVLVDHIPSAVDVSDLHPLHVACLDPRDDLRFSCEPPPRARTVLGGDPEQREGPASLTALTAELKRLTPGQAGLFYYSGHAVSEGLGGDDRDALALSGSDVLSAHALLSDPLAPPMPARVMLSACASSGAAGAGAGEWLGLTAAAIWRGARQVVATNWPIWDTPFTARFDHELARRLQTAPDPAASLRETQLEALAEWEGSDHDLADIDDDGGLDENDANLPFPLIWAAYSCVGVRT